MLVLRLLGSEMSSWSYSRVALIPAPAAAACHFVCFDYHRGMQMFLKGRTEALRTVTAEVKAFLEAFCNPDTSMVRTAGWMCKLLLGICENV